MSRYLALHAEQGKIYLASATTKGSVIRLEKAIVLSDLLAPPMNIRGPAVKPDRPGGGEGGALSTSNAAELGKRLKEALSEAGIAPGPVLIVVGRERVVLKEIRYPASVSASEEPNVIRFQVSKELADSSDNVVIDYLRIRFPNRTVKSVLWPLRAERPVECMSDSVQRCWTELVGVTPRPFGVAAALMRAIKDGAVTPPIRPTPRWPCWFAATSGANWSLFAAGRCRLRAR